MPDGLTSIGLVAGLDYRDPMFDPHVTFQHLKRHPFVASLLEGGNMVRYGAKALPEGGWHTIPRVYADGVLIAGDAGGFLNSLRLKGIHLAMRTGMLAAEAAFDGVRANDVSAGALKQYKDLIDRSDVRRELYPVRNVHQSFEHGLLAGLAYSGLSLVTGGWWVKDPMPAHAGYERMEKLADYYRDARPDPDVPVNPAKIDRKLTFDRLTNVHYSGTDTPKISRRTSSSTTPTSAARAAAKSTATRACGSVPPTCTRWSMPATAASACKSTHRTASIARRATSWTRTRSSTGSRPRAAEGRIMRGCEGWFVVRGSWFEVRFFVARAEASVK